MPLPVFVLQWQKFRICSVIEPLFWRKRQKKQPGLVCKEPVNVDSLICTVISRELKWIFSSSKILKKKQNMRPVFKSWSELQIQVKKIKSVCSISNPSRLHSVGHVKEKNKDKR